MRENVINFINWVIKNDFRLNASGAFTKGWDGITPIFADIVEMYDFYHYKGRDNLCSVLKSYQGVYVVITSELKQLNHSLNECDVDFTKNVMGYNAAFNIAKQYKRCETKIVKLRELFIPKEISSFFDWFMCLDLVMCIEDGGWYNKSNEDVCLFESTGEMYDFCIKNVEIKNYVELDSILNQKYIVMYKNKHWHNGFNNCDSATLLTIPQIKKLLGDNYDINPLIKLIKIV